MKTFQLNFLCVGFFSINSSTPEKIISFVFNIFVFDIFEITEMYVLQQGEKMGKKIFSELHLLKTELKFRFCRRLLKICRSLFIYFLNFFSN